MELDLPYLVRDKDRHGNIRFYVRMRGRAKVRLRAIKGTPQFLAEYQAALAGAPPPRPGAAPAPDRSTGTLAWLASAYYRSPEYMALEPQTRRTRRAIIDQCLAEPLKPGGTDLMGSCPLEHFSALHVRVLRDRKAGLPGAARNRVQAIKSMLAYGVEAYPHHVRQNAARDVQVKMPKTGGFHTWTAEEVRQFEERHPIGTKARLALALLLYTGARRGDMVTFGRQHVRNGELTFTPGKTAKRRPEPMTIPVLPELERIIAASPCGDLTFLVTGLNQPFTSNGFGNWFRDRCNEAGLPHCSAHGLRKAGATIAAEAGATDRQLMAMFGWSKADMASVYTRKADQKRLARAGMALVAGNKA